MRRVLLHLLTLALLFGPLGAARAGWECPDGRRCIPAGAEGFLCAAPAVLSSTSEKASCCASLEPRRCRHGRAFETPAAPGPAYETQEHCRLASTAGTDLRTQRWSAAGVTAALIPPAAFVPAPLPPVPALRLAAVNPIAPRPPPASVPDAPRPPPLT
jgi:hypothetical protein